MASAISLECSCGEPFKTPDGKAKYLAAYDAALKTWPVAVQELDVPTRFGTTHVIVSGPRDAPPLVLLHGYMATSIMWAPNIGDFGRRHRVYAIDIMGQPGRSVPGTPIGSAAEYVTWLTATLDALHLGCVDVLYLGIKHFRMSPETLRVTANPLSDEELRTLRTPVLLLIGEDEVLYDAAAALARASRLVPDFQGELVPGCRHDMCASQPRLVDARVLEFLGTP